MKAKVTGFTLIELVVVITILGILAAFAVPKFIALDTQARVATMNGFAGTVKSAAALARGLSMATNNAAGPVVMEGAYGQPEQQLSRFQPERHRQRHQHQRIGHRLHVHRRQRHHHRRHMDQGRRADARYTALSAYTAGRRGRDPGRHAHTSGC